MMTTPDIRKVPIMILQRPQWSLRRQVESIMVKTGEEKNIAVQSPMGRRSTASKVAKRKTPPMMP